MTESVPNAVQNCHELLLWPIPHLDKFPKIRRLTLGEEVGAGGAGSIEGPGRSRVQPGQVAAVVGWISAAQSVI